LNPNVKEEGEEKKPDGIPAIEVKEYPNFRTINVNWMYITRPGMYFEAIVYSQQTEIGKTLSSFQATVPPPTISRTLECRLVTDPFTAKSIAQILTAQVNEFETQFGHIPSIEELQQKTTDTESADKINPAIG
jgi:hypothetical protein